MRFFISSFCVAAWDYIIKLKLMYASVPVVAGVSGFYHPTSRLSTYANITYYLRKDINVCRLEFSHLHDYTQEESMKLALFA